MKTKQTVTKEYKGTPCYIEAWYETNKFNKDIFREDKKGDIIKEK